MSERPTSNTYPLCYINIVMMTVVALHLLFNLQGTWVFGVTVGPRPLEPEAANVASDHRKNQRPDTKTSSSLIALHYMLVPRYFSLLDSARVWVGQSPVMFGVVDHQSEAIVADHHCCRSNNARGQRSLIGPPTPAQSIRH